MEFEVEECVVNDQVLDEEIMKFTLFLYSFKIIPRYVVQLIIESIQNFMSKVFVSMLKNKIKYRLFNNKSFTVDKNSKGLILYILDDNKFPFRNFLDEEQRFKIYEKIVYLNVPKKLK